MRHGKRIGAIFLLGLSLLLLASSSSAQKAAHPLDKDLKFLKQHGLLTKSVEPQELHLPASWNQFLKTIGKALGIQPSADPSGDAYAETMKNMGLLEGKLPPFSHPISREEAAFVLFRLLGESHGKEMSAGTAVQFAIEQGWIPPFAPQQNLKTGELVVLAKKLYEQRERLQVRKDWQASPLFLSLKAGEKQTIHIKNQHPLPFSPVFGWNNPRIGDLSATGVFTARSAGNGLITVTIGNRVQQIYVKVTEGSQPSQSKAAASLPAEKEFTYMIQSHHPDQAFAEKEYKMHPGPIDGLSSESETWTGFLKQGGRDILVHFAKPALLTRISLDFLQDLQRGIEFPSSLQIYVSADGLKWNKLGRADSLSSSPQQNIETLSVAFPPVQARFVKIRFPVENWVFARQLTFGYGTQAKPAAPVVLPHMESKEEKQRGYMNIQGMGDMALIYSSPFVHQGSWAAKDFIPLASYVNESNMPLDHMFDTFLFLPYPSIQNWESWQAYLRDLFKKDRQLDALNQATQQIQERNPQLKVKPKVMLTLAYPDPMDDSMKESGWRQLFSFSKESQQEKWTARKEKMEVYLQEMLRLWKEAHFENLELAGIYWMKETVDASIPGDEELIQSAAAMIHQANLKFCWIPYYGAPGSDQWKRYGFDYAFLQPNYYATDTPSRDRMINAGRFANLHQMGLEMELDEKIVHSRYYYDLFYKQLNMAGKLQWDQFASNAYYMGGSKWLMKASRSPLPEARGVYEDLYHWIRGNRKHFLGNG